MPPVPCPPEPFSEETLEKFADFLDHYDSVIRMVVEGVPVSAEDRAIILRVAKGTAIQRALRDWKRLVPYVREGIPQ